MNAAHKKTAGRPVTTGAGRGKTVRLSDDVLADLDAWRTPLALSRPQALAQLVIQVRRTIPLPSALVDHLAVLAARHGCSVTDVVVGTLTAEVEVRCSEGGARANP